MIWTQVADFISYGDDHKAKCGWFSSGMLQQVKNTSLKYS